MSQQEDDLRALAKIMDFLRAVSIILMVIHLYWYCYEAVRLWGIDIGVVDRVLMNFDRTTGLFHHILYTKLFALLLLALSCLGTKGVKEEKITWHRIWAVLSAGLVLFFLNWWILSLPLPVEAVAGFYTASMAARPRMPAHEQAYIARRHRSGIETGYRLHRERQGQYPPVKKEQHQPG